MRSLTNQATSLPRAPGEGDPCWSFAGLLKVVVDQSAAKGLPVSEIRKLLKIIEILESEKEVLYFEEEQATKLKELVANHKWGVVHKDIVSLCDAVEAMPEVQMPDGDS